MEAYIDIIKDKVFVKSEGKVTEANIVKKKPTADEPPEVDEDQEAFAEASGALEYSIQDVKEKYELFTIGAETQTNLDKKITAYKTAKATYETTKSALS